MLARVLSALPKLPPRSHPQYRGLIAVLVTGEQVSMSWAESNRLPHSMLPTQSVAADAQ